MKSCWSTSKHDDAKTVVGWSWPKHHLTLLRRTLCEACWNSGKYQTITRKVAKRTSFLSEYDLIGLRTVSMENIWYRGGPYVRLCSLEDVRELSNKKLLGLNLGRVMRRRQQISRAQRSKADWEIGRKKRVNLNMLSKAYEVLLKHIQIIIAQTLLLGNVFGRLCCFC
jgi:hypothetical protein